MTLVYCFLIFVRKQKHEKRGLKQDAGNYKESPTNLIFLIHHYFSYLRSFCKKIWKPFFLE